MQQAQHTKNSGSTLIGRPLSEEENLGALTLAGYMAEVCQRYNTNEAMCWKNLSGGVQRWTYQQMYQECMGVARALVKCGIGKGARVGVLISNRPEWVFSVFGAAMTGATVVAMNTFSTQSELKYQLTHADVQILIMEAAVASKNFVTDINELCPGLAASTNHGYQNVEVPFLRRVVCIDEGKQTPGISAWSEFLVTGQDVAEALVSAMANSVSPVDNSLIFFSSGSTALPKAIEQTQRAAAMQLWRFGKWYQTDSQVRTWSANGFFFSGNFVMGFGSTFSVGGCLVMQRFFNPDEAIELFQEEKVSLPLAWPHQEARLKECPGWQAADLSCFQYVDKNGILATHPSVKSNWQQPNGYGMTETFTFVAGDAGNQILDGSYGPVCHGVTLKIIDPETGATLSTGETGEIVVKGPTLTKGYLKTPPEDMVDIDGFFHTADAGYVNEAGNLFWKGRLGDIIKTGGANVSPSEIDAAIVEHPSVQTVITCGVPHETLGELVVACIVLREGMTVTADEIKAFTKKTLASYKVPREVVFFLESELPKTGSNKIKRKDMRDLALTKLN